MTGSFSALGFSPFVRVRPGNSFTSLVKATALETFTGVVKLYRCIAPDGSSPVLVATYDGTGVAIDDTPTAVTFKNEGPEVGFYRYQCTNAGANDEANYTLSLVYDVVAVLLRGSQGEPVIEQLADGRIVIRPAVLAPGGVT